MKKDSNKQFMIDINRKDLYEYGKVDLKERTKNRLKQINKMGMTEVGTSQFGIDGIMSGLYIEKVWSYSEDDWNEYIVWVKNLIKKKTSNKQFLIDILQNIWGYIKLWIKLLSICSLMLFIAYLPEIIEWHPLVAGFLTMFISGILVDIITKNTKKNGKRLTY